MNKEYLGSLYVGKDRQPAGKALLLVEFVNDFPAEATIYLIGKQNSTKVYKLNLARSQILHLRTNSQHISLKFSGKRSSYIPLFNASSPARVKGSIDQLVVEEAVQVSSRVGIEEKSSGTKIIVQLPPVCFLAHELSWFIYEAMQNLDKLSEVKTKYEFKLSSVGEYCSLSPFLITASEKEARTVNFVGMHVLTFTLPESPNNHFAIDKIKPKSEILLKILSFLDNRPHNAIRLRADTTTDGIEYSYEEWNRPETIIKSCVASRFQAKDYLSILDKIYSVIDSMPNVEQHRIIVAFNRFLNASDQPDLSIRIALYHVVINILLKIIDKRSVALKNHKPLKKIFSNHGIIYEKADIDALVEFNNDRNQVFKELHHRFNYSKEVFERMQRVLMIIGKLFCNIFALAESEEKIIIDMIRNYHFLIYQAYSLKPKA